MKPIGSALPWPVVDCHNLVFRFWDAFMSIYVLNFLWSFGTYFVTNFYFIGKVEIVNIKLSLLHLCDILN